MRLDELFLGQWPAAQSGDPDAVDCCLRILAKRWRLLGLDQPRPQEQAEPARVMLVPVFESQDAWEQAAIVQQQQLKATVKD